MLTWGLIFVGIGIACYVVNVALIKHYLDKGVPGLLEIDAALPPPTEGQEYLWEKTDGTGIVPKWVSCIGLLPMAALPIGGVLLLIALIKWVITLFR